MTGTLVLAPHPDDEVLGCTSVLTAGPATVVHVSDGVPPWITDAADVERLRRRRIDECRDAWSVIGAEVTGHRWFGLADLDVHAALDTVVDGLVDLVARMPGATVYVPAYQRGHPDHDAVAVAAMLARRALDRLLAPEHPVLWVAYSLYGLDGDGDTRFDWLPPADYPGATRACGRADQLTAKARALRSFPSQLRPDSIVQQWLDRPQAEVFAPMPAWGRLPELDAYYIREMDLSAHGVVLDDSADRILRSALAASDHLPVTPLSP